jgi:hypothetical protein
VTDPFLFIVGYPRSGTTLLRAMFDSHPLLAVPDESHFIPSMAARRRRYKSREGFRSERFLHDLLEGHRRRSWWIPRAEVEEAFAEAPPHDLADAFRRVYACYARTRGKPRYGDKTPAYVLNIRRLGRLFPEGRFVHIIRDGRDAALSILDRRWGPDTVEEAAFRWRQAVRRGRSQGRKLGPERYREVRYEELVAGSEEVLRSLCSFAGLSFDPRMVRYYENQQLISERSWFRPISLPPTGGLRDWRRDMAPTDVAVFESLAGDLLRELGYEQGASPARGWAALTAQGRWTVVQLRRAGKRVRKSAGLPPAAGENAAASAGPRGQGD